MTECVEELSWPTDSTCYLTLDFECDYGTALQENTFDALDHTSWLVSLVEQLDIPLTCFVQTEVLEERPETVEALRSAGVPITFHPHSHTHRRRDETDLEYEVQKSTTVFEDFFEMAPEGYRLPNGNVRPSDYQILARHGYGFDASVFPSWRPGHFDNRNESLNPQYFWEHDLYEIPFTVYSNIARIPTALSYCRMLGRPYTELLSRRPPDVVVFNIHLHDIVNPPTFAELSPFYQSIYSRNAPGKPHLEGILNRFQVCGFSFRTIDDIYEALTDQS